MENIEALTEVLAYADKVLPARAERGTTYERAGLNSVVGEFGAKFAKQLVDFAKTDTYLKTKGSSLAFATKKEPLKIAREKILESQQQKQPRPQHPARTVKQLEDDLMKYFNRIREFLPTNPRHNNCITLPTHKQLMEQNEYWEGIAAEAKRRQAAELEKDRAARLEREAAKA